MNYEKSYLAILKESLEQEKGREIGWDAFDSLPAQTVIDDITESPDGLYAQDTLPAITEFITENPDATIGDFYDYLNSEKGKDACLNRQIDKYIGIAISAIAQAMEWKTDEYWTSSMSLIAFYMNTILAVADKSECRTYLKRKLKHRPNDREGARQVLVFYIKMLSEENDYVSRYTSTVINRYMDSN